MEETTMAVTEKTPKKAKESKGELVAYNAVCFPIAFPESWTNGQADGQFLTSLKKETKEQRLVILKALQSPCQKIDEILNVTVRVAGVTMHPAQKNDEQDGEIFHFIRVILHLADGRNVACGSSGIMKGLRARQSLMGDDMFKDCPSVVIRRVPTSGGRSMFQMDWQE